MLLLLLSIYITVTPSGSNWGRSPTVLGTVQTKYTWRDNGCSQELKVQTDGMDERVVERWLSWPEVRQWVCGKAENPFLGGNPEIIVKTRKF